MNEASSFRDPSGFIFRDTDGIIKRQINAGYMREYRYFIESGLYRHLAKTGMLVPHKELITDNSRPPDGIVIEPLQIPMISYPYEWSFGMLRDAALLTLRIQKTALEYGMYLKDASAYNIQFINGAPIFIDTLSFEKYEDGCPWYAYGQFCRHFFAPLYLMRYVDLRLNLALRDYIDGIPLDLAVKILRLRGNIKSLLHLNLHSRAIRSHAEDNKNSGKQNSPSQLSMKQLLSLVNDLEKSIRSLNLPGVQTEWGEYYSATNYSTESQESKAATIKNMIRSIKAQTVWDIGANDGRYTRVALEAGAEFAVAFDIDPIAVEKNYIYSNRTKSPILPLFFDFANPSPGIGFANKERTAISERGKPDCLLLLAVVHHMAISNNLPFDRIALWASELSDQLIIEFVPKNDSQVQRLLSTRHDVFSEYQQDNFEKDFSKYFICVQKQKIAASTRTLYLWQKK